MGDGLHFNYISQSGNTIQVLVDKGINVDEIKLYGDAEDADALDVSSCEDVFSELESVISKVGKCDTHIFISPLPLLGCFIFFFLVYVSYLLQLRVHQFIQSHHSVRILHLIVYISLKYTYLSINMHLDLILSQSTC